MVVFLFLLLAAAGLGIAGAVIKGFTYLLIAGILLFVLDVAISSFLVRRRRGPAR